MHQDGNSAGLSLRQQPSRPIAEKVSLEGLGGGNLSSGRWDRLAREGEGFGTGIWDSSQPAGRFFPGRSTRGRAAEARK